MRGWDLRECPKKECTIENHVHGHGTDEMYLPKQKPPSSMERKPGTLESLLLEAFSAGLDRGAWGEHGEGEAPPDYEQWRRGMLPDLS